MAKKSYWNNINSIPDIARTINTSTENIHQQKTKEHRVPFLNAFDLYTTGVNLELKVGDMHEALIMYAGIKKQIKEKL